MQRYAISGVSRRSIRSKVVGGSPIRCCTPSGPALRLLLLPVFDKLATRCLEFDTIRFPLKPCAGARNGSRDAANAVAEAGPAVAARERWAERVRSRCTSVQKSIYSRECDVDTSEIHRYTGAAATGRHHRGWRRSRRQRAAGPLKLLARYSWPRVFKPT